MEALPRPVYPWKSRDGERRGEPAMRTRHPLCLLICLVALLAARTALASCGDVDGDGAFGSSDLDDLLAYLADPVASPLSPDGLAQCTVTGRARPCDVLDVVVMRRNLDGLGPPLGDGCEDGDQDGVLDPADLCLSTPPGVAPLDTVSGCSPLDVMLDPESLTEPAEMDLAESATLLGAPEFATHPLILDLRDAVDLGMAEMALAAADVRAGNLCSAASQYGAALTEIALRRDVVQTEYTHLRLDLETDGPGPPDDHPGDGQLAVAALDIALVATDRAMATADVAAEAFDASCAAVAGPLSVSGVVRDVDDQLGVLILEDDSVIALPEGAVPQPIGPGGQVDVVGTQIAASAGVDIGIATNVDCPDCADSNPGNLEPACLHLRLAPVQGFAPFVTEPVTYHLLSSYEGNSPAGNLELEREMRFLVLQGWCEGSSSLFVKPRYSMKITIGSKTVAEDLVPGDGPVRIPSDVVLDQPQILTAVVRRQLCTFPNGCGPFTDYSTPLTWPVEVHERGSLCTAWNLVDQFDLEDNETGYRWQFMTGITKDPTAIQNADNPYFFAQTCDAPSVSPGCASGPIVTTPQGYGFKIFNQDFYPVHGRASGFQGFFLSKKHGVTAAVGMRWPSVAGFRNSSVYWYSCQVQPIVRDVVNFCASPAMEDSYYRYPVYPGGPGGGWSVANGNSDQNPGHAGLQSFAWDMVAPLGSRIRATRGGRVTMLKESSTPFTNTVEGSIQSNVCYQRLKTCHLNASLGSCTSSANCSGNVCAYGVCVTQAARTSCQNDYPCDNGNYLYVRHQDGTYATYWHMDHNDVTPVKDQILQRSDEVGGVGDTGNSTTEHLHYHVQTTNGIDTSASIRTRFQTAASQAPNNLCQIPGNGNTLPSSNDPLAFY
jgi:murein DD-endopeptidase MepM/ murein hydrolase activator NlpD